MPTSTNTATNVSVGKPKVTGAIYVAPLGTTLPTDATTDLNSAFVGLGYCSDDGVTNNNSPESDTIKAWGGDIVYTLQNGKDDTFQFTLIEAMNTNVLKIVFGDENVTGTASTGIAINNKNSELKDHSYVIDMILRNNTLKRIVIPDGIVSEVGEVVYKDDEAIGYQITLQCIADSDGVLHKEYIKTQASGTS